MHKGFWRWLAALVAVVCGLAFGLFAGVELVRAGQNTPQAANVVHQRHVPPPAMRGYMENAVDRHYIM
ncbi:MAG: hypothetical protein CVU19_15190 [Betaproteobacteria bacterium HGW-Betaproteobacteria-13]|jgi:hypothetical protein|uniref:Uncharacterized protein n=1 Tax=Parazoarcus communis TaxID=41977 RepID=A0A2U8H0L6_9RHOO|nr:hypothetical protein [Parazoarcus communis]AWI79431.1 hypothetical protein CEW87_08640 [Parazoarcus communis]PKO79926.1 MAG: hypothetical protein CVU19_15190 [Betaproteobacteria bacterium HGW-Betaproteobacteria-13]